jgi:hypothetical protein
VSPGFSRPSASARAITASAIRSFMLPVGFSHPNFTKMSAHLGGTTLRSRTIEVLPMALRMATPSRIGVVVTQSCLTLADLEAHPNAFNTMRIISGGLKTPQPKLQIRMKRCTPNDAIANQKKYQNTGASFSCAGLGSACCSAQVTRKLRFFFGAPKAAIGESVGSRRHQPWSLAIWSAFAQFQLASSVHQGNGCRGK